jgi:polyhydroxyalkanoate synthesis repressor PhaR
MSEPRIIKKYPNRRLYDTSRSRYITLEDVRKLVHDRVEFVVRDAQTDEDLTRSILLQIVAEEEAGGDPIFTIPALTQIIRFYGDAVQGMASDFLQRSLSAFGEQQQQFRRQLDQIMTEDAVGAMSDMARRNLALWQEMQGAVFGSAPPGQRAAAGDTGDGAGPVGTAPPGATRDQAARGKPARAGRARGGKPASKRKKAR